MAEYEGDLLTFCDADAAMRRTLFLKLNVPGRHRLSERTIRLADDGFTIVAIRGGEPIGVVSIGWRMLPAPHSDTKEAFIDMIDVDPEFRRQGIGRKLIELAAARAT